MFGRYMLYIMFRSIGVIQFACVVITVLSVGQCTAYIRHFHAYRLMYQMQQREQQLQGTHFCWYHGMSREMYVNLLANTYLDHFINKTPLSPTFLKLRLNYDFDTCTNSLSSCMGVIPTTRMLFVNMSFPGCITNRGSDTFSYFIDNRAYFHIQDEMVRHYVQDRHVQEQVCTIVNDITNKVNAYPCGVVLQVCISKHVAPQCVFISKPGGLSSNIYSIPWGGRKLRTTHAFCLDYIYDHGEIYRKWNQDPKDTIACIWLHSTWFTQPYPGIYMYAYHTFPQSLCDELYDRLQEVICQYA